MINTSDQKLKDDYSGVVDLSTLQYHVLENFQWENPNNCKLAKFRRVQIGYKTYGELNAARNNVLVICHALTGHPIVHEWWSDLLGPGRPFDTNFFFVICANMLGSCYGSSGPTSIDSETMQPYGIDFPVVSIRDSVHAHSRLMKEKLNINAIAAVVGGSIGGMQAIEWLFQPLLSVGTIVALSCGAKQSAWAIALNHIQRSAIINDPNWQGGHYGIKSPLAGLSSARQLAMCSYRTHHVYNEKFDRVLATGIIGSKDVVLEKNYSNPASYFSTPSPTFSVENYLEYQGKKFVTRFDPMAYIRLTQQTDSHDIGRGRGGWEHALRSIRHHVLIIGMTSDALYPISDQEELARLIPRARLVRVDSKEGHDGFLLEQNAVGAAINAHFRVHCPQGIYRATSRM